jgi:hypothetical protein
MGAVSASLSICPPVLLLLLLLLLLIRLHCPLHLPFTIQLLPLLLKPAQQLHAGPRCPEQAGACAAGGTQDLLFTVMSDIT